MKYKNKLSKRITSTMLCVLLFVAFFVGVCVSLDTPIVETTKSYNVLIEGIVESNDVLMEYWIGSGVIISKDGNIVTAKHCVDGATKLKITLQDGSYHYVTKYFKDKHADIAIIDIPGKDYNYSTIGDSDILESGDKLYNVGNANGMWENSVFSGRVYKNHFTRYIYPNTELIFLNMKVYGGCSGGGLYKGTTLYGIVVMGDNYNITLAVPSNIVKDLYKRYLTTIDLESIAELFLM